MYQCVLRAGERTIVTWLSDDKPFKVGNLVTLKDHAQPDLKWEVIHKGNASDLSEIKRGWDNDLKRDGKRNRISTKSL